VADCTSFADEDYPAFDITLGDMGSPFNQGGEEGFLDQNPEICTRETLRVIGKLSVVAAAIE
jgi:hypothetical protein